MPEISGPLAGVRVLELGSFIAGPFAGQLLGDYGADVIKIEPPISGDPMRRWGIVDNDESLWWPAIARNKRSVAIDLREERGRALIPALARQCDIVVENFRPGRLDEWGLDYSTLSEKNPQLVVVHISGFGQTGPMSRNAGFGNVGEAMGGIRYTTGNPDRPPSRAGISLGDALASMFGVIGALAALTSARATGRGQEVDVAIYEAVAALMESTMADFEVAGVTRTRSGSVLPGVAPSNAYRTADGGEVIIAGNADSVFARLCTAMDRPDLAVDERFATHSARGRNMVELDELIEAWTTQQPTADLLKVLEDHAVPAGQVFSAKEMLSDPQYAARGMVQRLINRSGIDVPMTGVVPRFEATPGTIRHGGPLLGEHTVAVLSGLLGLEDADIADLHAAGIVTSADGSPRPSTPNGDGQASS